MKQDLRTILTRLLDKAIPEWRSDDELRTALHNLTASELFTPPSVEEVTEYLRSLKVLHPEENATKFWNFYEAKGWMIGKNKMKNWKSAIKTWDMPKRGMVV